jgi:flavin-dependent thymidylate synthase
MSPPRIQKPDGTYETMPHTAEPYPAGHAISTSCMGCGKRLDDPIHTDARLYQDGKRPIPADRPSDKERETYKRPVRDHVVLKKEADPEEVTGTEVSTFVDKAMFDAEKLEEGALERPRVHLLSATPDPLGAVAAFAMMYEGRVVRDLAEITDDERRRYFDDCFNTALRTPLEAIDLHFMVEGLTRASWDQMRTQRTAVFAGESLRFAVKPDLKDSVRMGPSVMINGPSNQGVWEKAIDTVNDAYHHLIANGVPAEDARGLLPMNVLTRGHWKTNLRNLEAEIGKRLCTQAQFEWRLIHADLRRAITEYKGHSYQSPQTPDSPYTAQSSAWQFQYIADSNLFKPICFQKGACMFKAQMDRGCTIRERVDRGRFDLIRDEEWAADPKAAWVR